MAAVANNKDFANKVGVPTRVGKEFMNMTKKYKEKMQEGGKVKKGYKSGGTVRGYGMARGGKVCKIVTMKGM